MVLVYPESNQTDLVEVVGEDDTLAEFLDGMFGPDAPPLPWDDAGVYRREALEAYYQVSPFWGAMMTSGSCDIAHRPADGPGEAVRRDAAARLAV